MIAIGNELLTGKIRDENLHYLIRELRALGHQPVLALVVPDALDAIVDAVRFARARADLVLTTGGVGPTHDDVTLPALAAAFEVPLVRDPELTAAIHAYYGGQAANDDVLAMADFPAGAELIRPDGPLPIVRLERVYAFPGEPGALRRLFEPWKEALRAPPFCLVRVHLDADEGAIAPLLRRIQEQVRPGGVELGSYPRFEAGRQVRLLVTVEGRDEGAVRAAAETLTYDLALELGESAILAVEPELAVVPPGELARTSAALSATVAPAGADGPGAR